MSRNDNPPKGVEQKADTLIHGLQTALPAGVTQLTVGKVTFNSVADLVKAVEELVKPWKDARAARVVIAQVATNREEDDRKLRSFLADAKHTLKVLLGREAEVLVNFGIVPERPRKARTAAEKAEAAELAQKTRELRHTMGSRQKESIKASPDDVKPTGPHAEKPAA